MWLISDLSMCFPQSKLHWNKFSFRPDAVAAGKQIFPLQVSPLMQFGNALTMMPSCGEQLRLLVMMMTGFLEFSCAVIAICSKAVVWPMFSQVVKSLSVRRTVIFNWDAKEVRAQSSGLSFGMRYTVFSEIKFNMLILVGNLCLCIRGFGQKLWLDAFKLIDTWYPS